MGAAFLFVCLFVCFSDSLISESPLYIWDFHHVSGEVDTRVVLAFLRPRCGT